MVLSLTVAAVLLTATHVAFGDPEVTTGGWHLRGELPGPTIDLALKLDSGPVSRDAFRGIGVVETIPARKVYLKRIGERWFMENKQQSEKKEP